MLIGVRASKSELYNLDGRYWDHLSTLFLFAEYCGYCDTHIHGYYILTYMPIIYNTLATGVLSKSLEDETGIHVQR